MKENQQNLNRNRNLDVCFYVISDHQPQQLVFAGEDLALGFVYTQF